jgi:hypothetical protein
VCGDITHQLAADIDVAAVAQGIQIVLSGSKHGPLLAMALWNSYAT